MLRLQSARRAAHPFLARASRGRPATSYGERRPAERCRANVADTQVGIAPAAILILRPLEPLQPSRDRTIIASRKAQRDHSGCGRQRTAGQFPGPVPTGSARIEQPLHEAIEGGTNVRGGHKLKCPRASRP